jgi:acetolactate synthase-1/2/3 large subunit
MNGGTLLARCLAAQGVDRVFCVPGESYLALLDGLHGGPVDVVNARHEGGAAMMAEADGKLTGQPGVVMATRGPGATNAACGVHVAQQDSTPLLLLVGQIGRGMDGRDSFQEVDYRQMFGGMAKWVAEIRQAERIPEILNHAFHVALSGRPGPVVLALPEDMLREKTQSAPGPRVEIEGPLCGQEQAMRAAQILGAAQRPLIIAGGSRWDARAIDLLQACSERTAIPVAVTFRRQNLFDGNHRNYAGDLGLGPNPALAERVRDADAILLLGGRFSENPSSGFSLLAIPAPRQRLIHVHPGAEEIGRIYRPELGIVATPGSFLAEFARCLPAAKAVEPVRRTHAAYRAWTDDIPAGKGAVTLSAVIGHFREAITERAIIANGAGNYAIWLHRFLRYRPGMQLAPTSGSMGYGLPAGIAAAMRRPESEIFVFAGDGCFQMTAQEFALAAERRLKLRVLVCDNSQYGTIRMHQARDYPGRPVGTSLANPDFAMWAASFGATGIAVRRDAEFPEALAAARAAPGPALIHLKLDAADIAPGKVLDTGA